jgi:hypothetical protein
MPVSSNKNKEILAARTEKTINLLEVDRVRSPQFVSIYSNNANASASFFELRLLFGQILGGLGKDPVHIEDGALITMSWEHAQKLSELLQKTIALYEAQHGKVRSG